MPPTSALNNNSGSNIPSSYYSGNAPTSGHNINYQQMTSTNTSTTNTSNYPPGYDQYHQQTGHFQPFPQFHNYQSG